MRHELTREQSLVSSISPARREDRLQSADHFSRFSGRRSVSIFPAVSLHVLNRCLGSSRSWRLYQWLNNYDQDIDFLNSRKGAEGWKMFLWSLRGVETIVEATPESNANISVGDTSTIVSPTINPKETSLLAIFKCHIKMVVVTEKWWDIASTQALNQHCRDNFRSNGGTHE